MILRKKYAHWALLFCCFLSPSVKAAQSEEECQLQQGRDKFLEILYKFMDEEGQLPPVRDLLSHQLVKEFCESQKHRMETMSQRMLRAGQLLRLSTEELLELYNGTRENEALSTYISNGCLEDLEDLQDKSLSTRLNPLIAHLNLLNMIRRLFSLDPVAPVPLYPTISILNYPASVGTAIIIVIILEEQGIRGGNVRNFFSNRAIRNAVQQGSRAMISSLIKDDSSRKRFNEYMFYDFVSHMNNMDTQVDEDGRTLLMFCAMMGDLERVTFLCANGARVSIKDATGKSAQDYAEEFGRHQTKTFLEQQDSLTKVKVDQLRNIFDTIDSNPQLSDDMMALIHQFSCSDEVMTTLSSRFENPEQAKQHFLKLYKDDMRKFAIKAMLAKRGVQVPEA